MCIITSSRNASPLTMGWQYNYHCCLNDYDHTLLLTSFPLHSFTSTFSNIIEECRIIKQSVILFIHNSLVFCDYMFINIIRAVYNSSFSIWHNFCVLNLVFHSQFQLPQFPSPNTPPVMIHRYPLCNVFC